MKAQLTDQVRNMLRTIAQNADLICEGIEGSVAPGDAKRNARIDALVAVGALRPEDALSFRLNPRLRSYVEDQLGSFQAFRALTRIDPVIRHIETLWQEIQILRNERADEDALAMEEEFRVCLADLAYDIERNLQVLHANIHDEYGNVSSLKAKLRQNDFFLNEVIGLKASIDKLSEVSDRLKHEAVMAGSYQVEGAIRRNILINMLSWSQQVNDALHAISKRLYLAKKLHDRLGTLSRVSLWMRQRAVISVSREFDLDEDFNPLLLRPEPVSIVSHVDVDDVEDAVQRALIDVAASLKAPPAQAPTKAETSEVIVVAQDDEPLVNIVEPHEASLARFLESLAASALPMSLLVWKGNDPQIAHVEDEDWLLYAVSQLHGESLRVEHVFVPRGRFELNDHFEDIVISITNR